MANIVILTEGQSTPNHAKTACGLIRYRGSEVRALIDSTQAGKTTQEVLNVGGAVPIVSALQELDGLNADTLVIGIAPTGGGLPEAWRPVLREAITKGLNIVSGLHTFVGDDPEFRSLAEKHGVTIHDVRKPPGALTVSSNIAKDTACFRVHTVGNDCNVGKMSAAVELTQSLKRRGKNAEFIATGQTGILVSGWGVAVDCVASDFIAGAIEQLVLDHQDAEFLLIEGQGSLIHPLYSGVTLGLLHGCAPQAMVMCYVAGRKALAHVEGFSVPPLKELIEIYEQLASLICPSRVVAVCVNTGDLSSDEAEAEIKSTEDRLGLPATDPYRFDVTSVTDAIIDAATR